ncbi:MAG: uroporphyrinogen decarboxylase family protein [Candidatus Humimicrobiaceae bacterium]
MEYNIQGYKPSKKRLLAALKGTEMDKVPLFEHYIDNMIVEKILGYPAGNTCAAVGDPYRGDERASACGDMVIPMHPEDFKKVCNTICQDSMMVVACYTPFRKLNSEGKPELINDGSIKSRKDWKKVILPTSADVDDRMNYLRKYNEAVKGTDIAVTLQAGNMFVPVYRNLCGGDLFRLIYDEPAMVDEILDVEAEYFSNIVKAALKEGFDVLMAGDDLAHKHGMMIDPELLEKLYVPRAKKFYQPVMDADIPIIFDCDGNPTKIMEMILNLGCSAIFPIDANGLDYHDFKKKYGDRICMYGAIDTDIPIRGTAAETKNYVKDVVLTCKKNGRFVAGTISDVNQMPYENFVTIINTIHEFGRY